MVNKNFPKEDSEHLGRVILGSSDPVLIMLEAKLINCDDGTLKLSKPRQAQYDSKFIGRAAIIWRKYI